MGANSTGSDRGQMNFEKRRKKEGNSMMNSRLKTTTLVWLGRAAIGLALVAFVAMTNSTAQVNGDLNFRLLNIERRLDQLQIRVDTLDRAQQIQSVGASNQSLTAQAVLELQSQQVSLARELVLAQQQILNLQKTVDQLSARLPAKEKTEKPEEKKPPEKKGQVIKDKHP